MIVTQLPRALQEKGTLRLTGRSLALSEDAFIHLHRLACLLTCASLFHFDMVYVTSPSLVEGCQVFVTLFLKKENC